MATLAPIVLSDVPWYRETRERINSQATLVARLEPGTQCHRIATSVLLVLKDSLAVMVETSLMLEEFDRANRAAEL